MTEVFIKEVAFKKSEICNELLRKLPDWFAIESAIQKFSVEADDLPMFVAQLNNQNIGFISLRPHNDWTAELYVIAVHPDFHRKRIGKQLLQVAEEYLKQKKYNFISVKTLSPSREDTYYQRTRKFYEKNGFLPVEEFKALWGDANPCLLMIKSL